LRGRVGSLQPLVCDDGRQVPPMLRARMLPKVCGQKRKGNLPSSTSEPVPLCDALPSGDPEAEGIVASLPCEDESVPENVLIDWSKIYERALRIKTDAHIEEVVPDIDEENKATVLRARAMKAFSDLQSKQFWVKLMVANVARSPLAHALNAIQAYKSNVLSIGEKGYMRWFGDLLPKLLNEFCAMLTEDAEKDDGWWGLAFDETNESCAPEGWKRADVRDLIRRCVAGNCAEFIRRFGAFGNLSAQGKSPQWLLFEILNWRPDAASQERVDVIKRVQACGVVDDGFVSKVLPWFEPEVTQYITDEGRMVDTLLYDFLAYVDAHVIGDVQAIESQNSVLRIMTTRARNIRRDLLSSRHVIRHSDANLVSAGTYTADLKTDAQSIAKEMCSHDRFQPLPIPHVSIPRPQEGSGLFGERTKSVVKLVGLLRSSIGMYDVCRFDMAWPAAEGMQSFVRGPWYACGQHRKQYQGFYLSNLQGETSLPSCASSMRDGYASLLDVVRDLLVGHLPWPLPGGSKCELWTADVEWRSLCCGEVRAWSHQTTVKLPFKFRPSRGAATSERISLPLEGVDDDDLVSDVDLEQDLADLIDASIGDSNADGDEAEAMQFEKDSRGGGFGGEGLPESSVDLAEAILAENPLHPTFEVALDAAAQSGVSQIQGDGDEEGHGGDIATQNDSGSDSGSSSSGSSSSSSASSSGSSRASAMSNDAGKADPEVAPRAGHRGAALGPSNVWIDLACKFCGDASFAQIKDFSGFGRIAMYICRVKLADGSYPTRGCLQKRRQWSMHRSRQECKKWCLRWLERHRQCCDQTS
jgi:hypothetical protein